ncbi:MAG: TIGR01440 family protein [Lachnospiraceae bacterium]|nr:TIGR01440 family protein [Bacillota bacterium]MDD7253084.1 TIGR01440 family protein [Bacillota bacterium]MDY2949965.1 TIGR01440 family protein [Lachnospiraceae bacterium]
MEQNPQLGQIRKQAQQAVAELCDAAHLRPGALFVVGCSSSEVLGERIGTHTSMDVAGALYEGIASELKERGVFLAAQCCEHLNRALVVERTVLERYDLEQVNAIPQPNHAGGAFASVTWNRMADPVLVESLSARADAGIDIGGTLIGMHIHPVVVPVRISIDRIGEASILCARRRPKYVGGQRAIYDEALL